jgi:hypothetical protein
MKEFTCQECGVRFERRGSHQYTYCSPECGYAHTVTRTNPTLTASMVRQIQRRYTGQHGQQAQLAREYGLSPKKVWQIVHRTSWKHLL